MKNRSTLFKTGESKTTKRRRKEDFLSSSRWELTIFRCTQIKMYSWDNAQVVLVGNKCDLEEERAVTQERGKRLADQLGKTSFCRSSSSSSSSFVFQRLLLMLFCLQGFYRSKHIRGRKHPWFWLEINVIWPLRGPFSLKKENDLPICSVRRIHLRFPSRVELSRTIDWWIFSFFQV